MNFEDFKNGFQEILSGDVFTREKVRKQYRLILLIVFLFAVYINCGYRAQQQQKRIAELDRQIEEAQYEYLSVSAQLVEYTRQSVVARRLEEQGSKVKISDRPAILVD